MFDLLSAPLDNLSTHLCSHARSLRSSRLGPKGAAALAEGLKGNSTLRSLEWAAWRSNQSTRGFAFLSAPVETPPSLGSLAENQLCGLNEDGEGTYTAEGLTKLCEGLKQSAVTSLECATRVFAPMSASP